MIFDYLVQGLALGLTAAASPGPLQTYLINQSLQRGWRKAAPVIFSPLISDGPIVLGILLLLNQIPAVFLRLIGLAGGIFILYLAWGLWQEWKSGKTYSQQVSAELPQGSLWRGALINMLSPGPYTFWSLVNGPILLGALRQSWAQGAAFLVGFYGAMTISMLAIAIIFHQARRFGSRVIRGLILASILILLIFAILLIKNSLIA